MEFRFQRTFQTKMEFLKKYPTAGQLGELLGFKPEKILLIYDKALRKNESFKKWQADFPLSYALAGGERLKDLNAFPAHLKTMMRVFGPCSTSSTAVVGVGGGSVGDFVGFFSSVMKRGLPLVHMPSTLLAAMDSAHGGKTALNLGSVKNQIGTFYPADIVIIVRSLFEDLPEIQLQSAAGELGKMALLSGGGLFEQFRDSFDPNLDKIWDLLSPVIESKYKIVQADPFEKTGERQLLNLGHTFGHVLESYHKLPHGIAVAQGLAFCLLWSQHQGYFRSAGDLIPLLQKKLGVLLPKQYAKKHGLMTRAKVARFINEDKKLIDARNLQFVFLEEVGKPFRKVVSVESFLTETQRQGWTAV